MMTRMAATATTTTTNQNNSTKRLVMMTLSLLTSIQMTPIYLPYLMQTLHTNPNTRHLVVSLSVVKCCPGLLQSTAAYLSGEAPDSSSNVSTLAWLNKAARWHGVKLRASCLLTRRTMRSDTPTDVSTRRMTRDRPCLSNKVTKEEWQYQQT